MFRLLLSRVSLIALIAAVSDPARSYAAEPFSVDYRTASWKTVHFSDPGVADKCQADMVNLGCEIKRESHANHHDVSYLCSQWRRKIVPSHAEAHDWERWFKSNGFETRHSH